MTRRFNYIGAKTTPLPSLLGEDVMWQPRLRGGDDFNGFYEPTMSRTGLPSSSSSICDNCHGNMSTRPSDYNDYPEDALMRSRIRDDVTYRALPDLDYDGLRLPSRLSRSTTPPPSFDYNTTLTSRRYPYNQTMADLYREPDNMDLLGNLYDESFRSRSSSLPPEPRIVGSYLKGGMTNYPAAYSYGPRREQPSFYRRGRRTIDSLVNAAPLRTRVNRKSVFEHIPYLVAKDMRSNDPFASYNIPYVPYRNSYLPATHWEPYRQRKTYTYASDHAPYRSVREMEMDRIDRDKCVKKFFSRPKIFAFSENELPNQSVRPYHREANRTVSAYSATAPPSSKGGGNYDQKNATKSSASREESKLADLSKERIAEDVDGGTKVKDAAAGAASAPGEQVVDNSKFEPEQEEEEEEAAAENDTFEEDVADAEEAQESNEDPTNAINKFVETSPTSKEDTDKEAVPEVIEVDATKVEPQSVPTAGDDVCLNQAVDADSPNDEQQHAAAAEVGDLKAEGLEEGSEPSKQNPHADVEPPTMAPEEEEEPMKANEEEGLNSDEKNPPVNAVEDTEAEEKVAVDGNEGPQTLKQPPENSNDEVFLSEAEEKNVTQQPEEAAEVDANGTVVAEVTMEVSDSGLDATGELVPSDSERKNEGETVTIKDGDNNSQKLVDEKDLGSNECVRTEYEVEDVHIEE